MLKAPKDVRRPTDTKSAAVMAGLIAAGEIEDKSSKNPDRVAGGKAGGKARAKALSSAQWSAIAQKAANARWAK